MQTSPLINHFAEVDKIIERINQKANANNTTATGVLFEAEISKLRELCETRAVENTNSFFHAQLKPEKTGFWHWLMSHFHDQDKLAEHVEIKGKP